MTVFAKMGEGIMAWTDAQIRVACFNGTLKEFLAYARDGYILKPERFSTAGTMQELACQVAQSHGITPNELKGPCRSANLVEARQEFCVNAYNNLSKTLPQIGRFLSRDHTTILYYLRRAGVKLRPKKAFREEYCFNGHRWTEETTYISPAGSRQCRACVKERRLKINIDTDEGTASPDADVQVKLAAFG
jgi:hypothetical protein